MVKGSEVYRSIEDKIREVERQKNSASSNVNALSSEIKSLSDERDESFYKLANLYLPDMEASSVKSTLKECRRDVEEIFEKKNRRIAELETSIEESGKNRSQLQEKLASLSQELSAKADERDEISSKIAADLGNNNEYTALKASADEAQQNLNQNKTRAETFEKEARIKLAPYENSKLFMYLVRRRFGTAQEAGNGLTKTLDSFVAGVVSFRENKKNYDFLKAMLGMINEEVQRQQKALDEVVDKLKVVENAAAERYGLPKIVREGEKIGKQRAEVMQAIDCENKAYTTFENELKGLRNTKGKYHKEAIARLKDYLGGENLSKLKSLAAKTDTPDDDGLVAKVEKIGIEIEKRKKSLKELKSEFDSYSKKLSGLREIEGEFTRRDFESSRSVFSSGFDVDDLLTGYLLGRMSASQVNSEMNSHQHFKPKQTHNYSNSYSSSSRHSSYDDYGSSSSSSSSSFGFGGDSFSSGGGFGGGGFSSGSGF